MITAEKPKTKINCPTDVEDEDIEEYSDEFIEELENEAELTYLQIKTGKKPYVPLEELAQKFGVDLRK